MHVMQTIYACIPGPRSGNTRLCCLLAAVVLAAACGRTTEVQTPATAVPAGWFASQEAIAGAMLEAVNQRDSQRLRDLSITEQEYRQIVWPNLKISTIESWKKNYDFVWKQHAQRSLVCLSIMLERYGGKQFSLVTVKVREGAIPYRDFIHHKDVRLVVTDQNGKQHELNLFGSLIEYNGAYKVVSYNTH